MKKSNFVALILGTISGLLFALGMCMALLPEWDLFIEGIILGAVGVIIGITALFIWRKMEKKAPIKVSGKKLLLIAYAVAGCLVLGVGMCLCLVWANFLVGSLVGILGIVMLISLIPIIKGIK